MLNTLSDSLAKAHGNRLDRFLLPSLAHWHGRLFSSARAMAALLLCAVSLVPLAAPSAWAGETITWPGNGVLQDVTLGSLTYADSLAPSASSPSGNSVVVSGGSLGGAGDGSGFIVGGYANTGNATGNSVSISGGSFGGGGADSGTVRGGYAEDLSTGDVTHNTVTL